VEAWKVQLPVVEDIPVCHPFYELIANFFTMILEMSQIPDEWKDSKIVSVFNRKSDPVDIKNYRPYSKDRVIYVRNVTNSTMFLMTMAFRGMLED
jgi:hypothetical protein